MDAGSVLIAGGGPVGSVLALALARAGLATVLVDGHAASSSPPPASLAQRPIALSTSSARILETLGVWADIAPRACAIAMVHVAEQSRFGAVRLRASEYEVPALGYVTDSSVIGAALNGAVDRAKLITQLRPARVSHTQCDSDRIRVSLQHGGDERASDDARNAQLASPLLVVAEGGLSSLREQLGIVSDRNDYDQTAVVCTVWPQIAHQGVAWERFTDHGPLAMLPLIDGDCAVVWTLPHSIADEVLSLGDDEFLRALRSAFGHRLGRLARVSARSGFALSLARARELMAPRVALIGNAANQLHPVAGQGLNLGLRDAAVLAELVAGAARAGADVGAPTVLLDYSRRRRTEHRGVVCFTDALARGFSHRARGPGWLRSAGMLALDVVPVARHLLARHAMGLGGAQSRLVRGLDP